MSKLITDIPHRTLTGSFKGADAIFSHRTVTTYVVHLLLTRGITPEVTPASIPSRYQRCCIAEAK